MNPFHPGQIVRSKAGRDKGRFLVVMSVVDDQYVLVSDGDLRKAGHPKRKKVMHLAKTNTTAAEIETRLLDGKKVSNAELREILNPFNTGAEPNKVQSADIPKGESLG